MLDDLDHHLTHECGFVVVDCPFKPHGCAHACTRREMALHHADAGNKHAELTAKQLEVLSQANRELEQSQSQLSARFDELSGKVKRMIKKQKLAILQAILRQRNRKLEGMLRRTQKRRESMSQNPRARTRFFRLPVSEEEDEEYSAGESSEDGEEDGESEGEGSEEEDGEDEEDGDDSRHVESRIVLESDSSESEGDEAELISAGRGPGAARSGAQSNRSLQDDSSELDLSAQESPLYLSAQDLSDDESTSGNSSAGSSLSSSMFDLHD